MQPNHTLFQTMTQKIHLCCSRDTLCRPCNKVGCLQSLEQFLQCLPMFLPCPGMYKQVVNVMYYIVHAIEEFPHCPRHRHTGIHHPKWHSQVLVMLTHCHQGSFMYICRTDPYLVVAPGQIKLRKIPLHPHAMERVSRGTNWLRVNNGDFV